jgi:hypothetical protein
MVGVLTQPSHIGSELDPKINEGRIKDSVDCRNGGCRAVLYLQNYPPMLEYSVLISFSVACKQHLSVHPEKEVSFYPVKKSKKSFCEKLNNSQAGERTSQVFALLPFRGRVIVTLSH